MNFVGEDELLDFNSFLAEACGEINGLHEIDVAVVVAMNEKNGRLPSVYGGDGGRIVRQFRELGRDIYPAPVVRKQVMHTVKIHARGEEVRVASQTKRC